MTDIADVTAVVVSYNTRDLNLRCIASLRADGVQDVVVVDNDSRDDSVAVLRALDPPVRVDATTENPGFAGGINRAVAQTSSAYVLVTTPDVIVAPGSTKVLVECLDEHDDVALAAPRVVTPDGRLYPSVRRFPNLLDALGHAFLQFVWPRNPFSRRYRMLDWDHGTAADVDWVAGTHFLVRRSAWDAVGGFDDNFFMFVEDVDLCWRLHEAGWRIRYEPAGEITHYVSSSTDKVPYRMIAAHHRSLYHFNRKRLAGARRALLPVIGAGLAVRTVLAWVQRAWRGKPHAAH